MTKEVLDQLVGQDKKFKTIEDLAKGKVESDAFIEQLKTEKAALLKDLEALDAKAKQGATLDEIMKQLKERKSAPGSEGKDGNQPALSDEELQKVILDTLQKKNESERKAGNKAKSETDLLTKFNGDKAKAEAFVKAKAEELGVSVESLNGIAETSPKAYAKMIGLDSVTGSTDRSVSGLNDKNTDALKTGVTRDSEYYKNLKKTNRRTFWSPQTQQELFRYGQKHGMESLNEILNS